MKQNMKKSSQKTAKVLCAGHCAQRLVSQGNGSELARDSFLPRFKTPEEIELERQQRTTEKPGGGVAAPNMAPAPDLPHTRLDHHNHAGNGESPATAQLQRAAATLGGEPNGANGGHDKHASAPADEGFSYEPVYAPTNGPITLCLPGLENWPVDDLRLLYIVCTVIWELQWDFNRVIQQIEDPYAKAGLAEKVLVATATWPLIHESLRDGDLNEDAIGGYNPGVYALGLLGLSETRAYSVRELLEAVCLPLYHQRHLILRVLEKTLKGWPEMTCQLAEALVIAEEVLNRGGYQTDLANIKGAAKEPSPLMRQAWEAKAAYTAELLVCREQNDRAKSKQVKAELMRQVKAASAQKVKPAKDSGNNAGEGGAL